MAQDHVENVRGLPYARNRRRSRPGRVIEFSEGRYREEYDGKTEFKNAANVAHYPPSEGNCKSVTIYGSGKYVAGVFRETKCLQLNVFFECGVEKTDSAPSRRHGPEGPWQTGDSSN